MFFCLANLVSSWGGAVHTKIGNQAVQILYNDMPYVYKFFKVTNKDYFDSFLTGLVDPDKVETAAGTHYYVYPGPGTINVGQYYKNAKRHASDESARTRLEARYKSAIAFFKKGNKRNAFLYLGRACHYLGDIGCTVHSAGIQYPVNEKATNHHKLYETYANKVINDASIKHATTAVKYYGTLDNPGIYLNKLCHVAYNYKDLTVTKSEAKYLEAIKGTIGMNEMLTAALLERFYRDTK